MEKIQCIVIIILCCGALGKGAAWLVDSAARIAHRFGISDLVIGLTIVAFGSSAPEFAVTVSAALAGKADMSVGNIVGSNIFNIGFILGGCALVTALKTGKTLVWRDGMVLLAVTILLLVMLRDHSLGRFEGIALFLILIGYLTFLFYKKDTAVDDDIPHQPATWKDGFFLVLGLVMIAAGGHFMVNAAEKLAGLYGLSQWVIAMTVVAAGTSVPEFVISLVALIKKHHGMSVGNLIGSNIFNTLGVLGVAGAIQTTALKVDPGAFKSIAMLIPLTLVVIITMRTGWKVSKLEGAILIILSAIIWGVNFIH
jgi:cation:H+ antiporter